VTLSALVLLLVIAVVCGGFGQAIAGYSLGGFLVGTAVGLVGAVLAMWIAGTFNLPLFYVLTVGGVDFPIVWAVGGSALFVAVLGVLIGGKRW
jgi:uncharacterized membrane protein YeaQ/YmgE (transglycosylase-associated protein family)